MPDVETGTALARAARDLVAGSTEAQRFLAGWPDAAATRALEPEALPVLAFLDAAPRHATPSTRPLVEALATAAETLAWRQTYRAAEADPAFLARYGWTEFIGLSGPIPSETVACGILVLGPDTDYPAHAHAAEELYLPLAGTALWMKGRGGYVPRSPGTTIHHPPWVPHAMRTQAEPLVALYVWRGDGLATPARILGRP